MKLNFFLILSVSGVLSTSLGISQTTVQPGAGGNQTSPAVPNNGIVAPNNGGGVPNNGTVNPPSGAVVPNNNTVVPNNGAVVPDSGAMVPTNRSFGGVASNGVGRGMGTNGFNMPRTNGFNRGTNGFNRPGTNGFGTNGFYRGPNTNNYPGGISSNNIPVAPGQNR